MCPYSHLYIYPCIDLFRYRSTNILVLYMILMYGFHREYVTLYMLVIIDDASIEYLTPTTSGSSILIGPN